MLHAFRHGKIPRLALCGAVLAGFVLALLMAASPELHERLHHEAGEAEHTCLAATFESGGCDDAVPAPALSAFVAMLLEVAPTLHAQRSGSLFLAGCVFEHAPPFVS